MQAEASPPTTGHIFTFYSYKGGVGRSMALANIGEYFYLKGLRVIMIDWDLEAPGLETFFFKQDEASTQAETSVAPVSPSPASGSPPPSAVDRMRSRLGLIDLLNEYIGSYEVLADSDPEVYRQRLGEAIQPQRFLQSIHRSDTDTDPAALSLMTAGWRGGRRFSAYAEAVQAFDWNGFYDSYSGRDFFDWFAAELKKLADVILIDSRTGVTEMGGVCARHLADVVVSLCAPNSQNIEGIQRMIRSFNHDKVREARQGRRLDAMVVPTRIENAETDRLNLFLKRFGEQLDTADFRPDAFNEAKTTFRSLAIPYVTTYAFEEDRVFGPGITGADPLHRLEEAYEKLAIHLALLTPDGHPVRRKLAAQLQRTFPDLLPPVVVSFVGSPGEQGASIVRGALSAARIGTWPDLDHRGMSQVEAETCIRLSRFLIVIATEESVLPGSPLEAEARLARQLGKHIFVVAPKDVVPAPWLFKATWFTAAPDSIAKLIATIRDPPPVVQAPNTAPSAPEKLVGREDVLPQLNSMLVHAAQSTVVTPVVIAGAAGYGKSALAAAACHNDLIDTLFPGGLLWITASAGQTVAEVARRLLELLGEQPAAGDDTVRAARRRMEPANVLIVLDGCEDAALARSVAGLLTRGALLVTTRRVDVAVAIGGSSITVGPLSDSAAELLLESAPKLSAAQSLTEEQRAVAATLEDWPVGLLLLRELLQQRRARGESVDAAWASIAESFARHGIAALDQVSASSSAISVRAALSEVFRGLADDAETERHLVRLVSHFRLQPFTLSDARSLLGGSSGASAYAVERNMEALNTLQRLSLLQTGEKGLLSIHPLLLGYLVAEGRVSSDNEPPRSRRFSSSRDKRSNELVQRARDILAGQSGRFEELQTLAAALKAARYFGYARRLLLRARNYPEVIRFDRPQRIRFAQQLAVCTYKDAELVPEQRFARALEFLHEADDLSASRDQETLGKAGAIYKYRWMFDGNREHLERSLSYYRRGYREGVLGDDGYTAINAAFVLDVLASQEEQSALRQPGAAGAIEVPATVAQRRADARAIRQDVVALLTDKLNKNRDAASWWLLVTLAEACFGLGITPEGTVDQARYSEALRWFREALAQKNDDWEYETTARQLAAIATMQERQRLGAGGNPAEEPEWQALRVFVGNHAPALRSLAIGKVGLALSGGGFRASLFHIGVLAKLADADVLRHIEVLSCVSGGSIIGAYYYLELKKLLESKPDGDIERSDYVALVARVQREFLAGVQRNIRTRIATNPFYSLRMTLWPYYNRTDRVGKLYERQLFARAGRGPRFMHELYIVPPGEESSTFAPKLDNWWRSNKVPELIINATTVNTGHNWQFTASWMGEPASGISGEIDGNDRLRRMYYWEAPKPYRDKVTLGTAVAASSCVPGVFEPLAFPGLYPGRVVRLVDGGVHDNQGLSALIENECKVLIVSDASGQMSNQARPGTGLVTVTMRSNDMLMSRVREAQFRELVTRRDADAIHEFSFVHLKKGLQTDPIDWVGCDDPFDASEEARPAAERGPLTSYGILKTMQEQLAAIRTDLDSFTEIEAYALMDSGYRMIEQELRGSEKLRNADLGRSEAWPFLAIEPYLGKGKVDEEISERVNLNLRIAKSSGLKLFRIPEKLGLVIFNALAIVAIFLSFPRTASAPPPPTPFFPAGHLEMTDVLWLGIPVALLFLLITLLVVGIYRLGGIRKSLTQALLSCILIPLFPIAWLHLMLFDRWYLSWGRLKDYGRRRG